MAIIMEEVKWVQRDGAPRKEYWATLKGESYTYGRGQGERTYEPNPIVPSVEHVRTLVKEMTGEWLEGCFLNLYETGNESLGWHSDDDPGINHDQPIVVVSLGAERTLEWREIGAKGYDSIYGQKLASGSLFLMPPGMQYTHVHRIPKAPQLTAPRISLTFRGLL